MKMASYSKSLFVSLFFFLATALQAQTNPYGEVSIASPTAASLGKYADIPVNYHTGIPQINIPLYTVEAGPLKLPISLDYHASGLKVNETASWVGAGWSLDAAGVITRTVMGQPDEKATNCGSVSVDGYFTDYGYNKYLYTGSGQGDQDWTGFSQNRKDGQPDLFFFNFGGYSGKFFFREDRMAILVPQQDLKIVPYYPDSSKSIQGFTITTPDGTQYLFGNTPGFVGTTPTELTNPYSSEAGYVSGTALSSWYLNKMISNDGQFSINFSYTPENYGYYTIAAHTMSSNPGAYDHEFDLVKNIISGVRLSQISFPNGTVTFNCNTVRTDLSDNIPNNSDNVNTNAKSLDWIDIANNNGFCKRYTFNYGYFTDNNTAQPTFLTTLGYTLQTDKKRLRLDSVRETSCDLAQQIPAHKFTYFSEMVPRRLSLGMDHWGFYNGVTSNQTLIPTFKTFNGATLTPVNGADRNAEWPAMRGGALQEITYPTGGSTTFDFEPCDSYTSTTSDLESVQLQGYLVHIYGQGSFTQTLPFTSNGNPITLSVTNSANYSVAFTVKDGSNNLVYNQPSIPNNNYPGSETNTFTISLAAGNYSATLSINASAISGAQATLSQLAYVTNHNPVVIGGLRIKTITHKESPSTVTPMVTNYTYPNGGYLYGFPTYVQHIRNDIIASIGFYLITGGGGFQHNLANGLGCPLSGGYYVKSGGSIRAMGSTQGNHIGYPVVKVSQTGNGYSIYNYYTGNSGYGTQSLDPSVQTIDVQLFACGATEANYPPAPPPFDYRKGELYYEQHYNEAGQLLKDAYYYPSYDTANLQPAEGLIVEERPAPGGSMGLMTFYNWYSPRKTKMYVAETAYSPGLGSITTNTYTYYGSSYHNQITRKVVSTSPGDSLITNTKYTADFHVSGWDPSPTCDAAYQNNCSTCLTTYNNSLAGCAGNGLCLADKYLIYRRCLSNARNTYADCQVTNYTGPNNHYVTQHDAAKSAATVELKPILELQDENRIVPIEVTDWKNSNLLHANFTRYDYVSSPSGIPFPNKTQLVNLQAPSSTFTNAYISGTLLNKDSRYVDEATYNYAASNPVQVTAHDGVSNSYIWDYLNTEPIAKVSNAPVDQIAFTSFESDGKGGWTFNGTPAADASALTGGKDYTLNGSNNITKSGLSSAKSFIVSYWSKTGSATVNGSAGTLMVSANAWKYYEHKLTAGITSVTVSGSVTIDELRLYPSDAQMNSYTYSPLVGMTTSADANSHITYYQYDGLGRLITLKDQDGNILKTIQYHYKGQVLP